MHIDSAGAGPPELAGSSSSTFSTTGTLSLVLKYSAQISTIPNCSKAANAPFNGPVYRGIAGPEATAADFLPHAILYPGLEAKKPLGKRCPYWALSMFESPAQLRKRFGKVKKTAPNYEKLVGMHCARLDLTKADGIRTHANADGHLEFFPYETFEGIKAVVSVHAPTP
jgi:hypothetical protein